MSGGAPRRWKSSNGNINSVETTFDGAPRWTSAGKERKVTQVDALGNPTVVTDTGAGYTDTMTYAPWLHWLASSSPTDAHAFAYTTDDTLLVGDRTRFDFDGWKYRHADRFVRQRSSRTSSCMAHQQRCRSLTLPHRPLPERRR